MSIDEIAGEGLTTQEEQLREDFFDAMAGHDIDAAGEAFGVLLCAVTDRVRPRATVRLDARDSTGALMVNADVVDRPTGAGKLVNVFDVDGVHRATASVLEADDEWIVLRIIDSTIRCVA